MTLVLTISYFIHLVATVVWLGGLVMFSLFIYPLLRGDQHHVLAFQKRFRPMANLSLVLLLGTGMIQMSADSNYEGFLTIVNTWSLAMLLKHVAFGAMIVIALLIQFSVAPAIERANLLASRGDDSQLTTQLARETRLNWLQMSLGGLVLIFTALATAL